MSNCDNMSEVECRIIQEQVARRARYRQEYLKLRTDPCQHSMEAGYVGSRSSVFTLGSRVFIQRRRHSFIKDNFDPAMQKFISMKCTQSQMFQPNRRSALFGLLTILPMFVYGAIVWKERSDRERDCRCGKLRYRDRLFKLQ